MGVEESACSFSRSRKAGRHSVSVFFFIVTLFGIASAEFTWTKQPTNPTFGVLGENVTLEWDYNITVNDKLFSFDLKKLVGSKYKDAVKYTSGGSSISMDSRIILAKKAKPVFLIINTIKSYETSYCCYIVSHMNNNESCVKLELLAHPSITAISRNQTTNESNDITLSCNATGKPPPNVTWSRQGNKEWKYHGSVLLLMNISRDQHGAEYWCTAKNSVSNTTASVTITVNYAPSFTLTATSYNVTEGESVELYCASDGRPLPTVTWSKINALSNRTYSSGQRLNITKTNRTEAGTYTCTAANGIGEPASTTMQVNVFYPPSINRRPTDQTLNETQDLRVVCLAIGNPMPYVTWSKETLPHPTPINSADGVLTISNVNKTHSGVYQCKATNGFGSGAFASITVTVNYKPIETSLTSDAQSNLVVAGHSVTFFCTADSLPRPQLELRFNNTLLGYFANDTMTLQRVNSSNHGTYECVPRNILGTGPIATLNLTVQVPPSIDYISDDITVNETDDVKIFCNASGSPKPNITWTFLGDFADMKPVTKEGLLLPTVNRNQSGRYRCTAANGVSRPDLADVPVTINYKPEIKGQPLATITSWLNHETEVTCKAEGVPLPDIVWSRNGTVTSSVQQLPVHVSKLKFIPKEASDFADITCTAKNLLGLTQASITVKQLDVPEAPKILKIHLGRNDLEIHWEVSTAHPQNPILSYIVQVKEKGESQEWVNCTRITRQSSSMMCVMEELKSNTEYIVRVSARNKVGYSEFTVKEVSTKEATENKEKQRQLPGSTVDWIIGGVIGGCALLVILGAVIIAIKRRSQPQSLFNQSTEEVPVDGRSSKKVTITNYDNPTMESSLQTDVSEEQAK